MKTKILIAVIASAISFNSLANQKQPSEAELFFFENWGYAFAMSERCPKEPYVQKLYSITKEVMQSGLMDTKSNHLTKISEKSLDKAYRMPIEMCSGVAEMAVKMTPYYASQIGFIKIVYVK